MEFNDKISILGVTLGSDLSQNDDIISLAKAAACKLDFLFLSTRFFTVCSDEIKSITGWPDLENLELSGNLTQPGNIREFNATWKYQGI